MPRSKTNVWNNIRVYSSGAFNRCLVSTLIGSYRFSYEGIAIVLVIDHGIEITMTSSLCLIFRGGHKMMLGLWIFLLSWLENVGVETSDFITWSETYTIKEAYWHHWRRNFRHNFELKQNTGSTFWQYAINGCRYLFFHGEWAFLERIKNIQFIFELQW